MTNEVLKDRAMQFEYLIEKELIGVKEDQHSAGLYQDTDITRALLISLCVKLQYKRDDIYYELNSIIKDLIEEGRENKYLTAIHNFLDKLEEFLK